MQSSRRDLAISAVLAAIKNDEDAGAAEAAIAALPIGTFSDEATQLDAHDGVMMKSFRPLIDRIKRRFRLLNTSAIAPSLNADNIIADCLS